MPGLITGTVMDAEIWEGYLHATLTSVNGRTHNVAAPVGSPQALAINDAQIHGDQIAIGTLIRRLDIDNPHDRRPRVEAETVTTIWRIPRIGDDATWGPMPRDNVVEIAIQPSIPARRRLALAA